MQPHKRGHGLEPHGAMAGGVVDDRFRSFAGAKKGLSRHRVFSQHGLRFARAVTERS